MEIFFSKDIDVPYIHLDEEESAHCVRVLRHKEGESIFVIDGEGALYSCTLTDASPRSATARIDKVEPDWGSHPYHLTMAVCPTKNNERFEWFAEKATELGIDVIAPVIGDHSERRIYKTDRLRRILLSASKQSLKGAVPEVTEPVSVRDFISGADKEDLNLIACCFEGEVPRTSINQALTDTGKTRINILIGPEGDFSREETGLAMDKGFIPVHIGPSRLRTETAALSAVEAVYLLHI